MKPAVILETARRPPVGWIFAAVAVNLVVEGSGLSASPVSSAEPVAAVAPSTDTAKAPVDRLGDPLPPGALARAGTIRFRDGKRIAEAVLSPDGKLLAVAQYMERIRLLDAASGKEIRSISVDPLGVEGIAFSPDGQSLASAGYNGVALWEVATGRQVRQFLPLQGAASFVTFSADGKTLAALYPALGEKLVRIWETASGKSLGKLELPPDVNSVRFALAPDGKTLAWCGQYFGPLYQKPPPEEMDRSINLWGVGAEREVRRLISPAMDRAVSALAFSPDGRTLATGSEGSTVRLWDPTTAKELRQLTGPAGTTFSLTFSPDGKVLAVGSLGKRVDQEVIVELWETATGKRLSRSHGPKDMRPAVFFPPGGPPLALASNISSCHLWEAATGKRLTPTGGHTFRVHAVAFSLDGREILSASRDGSVCRWEAGTGREVGRSDFRDSNGEGRPGLHAPAFSPNGKYLASGGVGGRFRVWEAASDRLRGSWDGFQQPDWRFAFSPDSRLLAVGAGHPKDDAVKVWDLATGSLRHELKPGGGIEGLALSADNRYLAAVIRPTGGLVSELRWWVVATRKRIQFEQRPSQHPEAFNGALAFSPDGQLLAASSGGPWIGLYDTATGRELHPFEGVSWNLPLVFSPDGRVVAVGSRVPGSYTPRVLLLEVASRQVRCSFEGHLGQVNALAFSPDGRVLASGSDDTTVLLWDVRGQRRRQHPLPARITDDELKALWSDLATVNAQRAYQAMVRLSVAAADSAPFLARHLRPEPKGPDAQTVNQLILDLDDEQFTVRQEAARRLEQLGPVVKPALVKVLENRPSLEVRRRLEDLLGKLDRAMVSREQLRRLRAVEILEWVDSPDAQRSLQALAGGAPEARLTQEARAAVERLAKGPASLPSNRSQEREPRRGGSH